jgi:hypothetical protein
MPCQNFSGLSVSICILSMCTFCVIDSYYFLYLKEKDIQRIFRTGARYPQPRVSSLSLIRSSIINILLNHFFLWIEVFATVYSLVNDDADPLPPRFS